jgi:poly(A) polymerase
MSAERLTERLVESQAVQALLRAEPEPDSVWIVGGALRDAALGREVIDLDLAVSGEERAHARALARAIEGQAFELSAEFATWRVVSPQGWHVDLSAVRGGGIDRDLAGRDFTVNALAVGLSALGTGSATVLDRHGGIVDLERRVLRAVSARSFADDPLRMMRGARIAAELGFELDPGTIALAREAAPRAAEPAGERQFAELRAIVTGSDPVRGLEHLDELGARAVVLPELEALRGVIQNPNHHLDVLDHTLEVLARLLEIEADLPRFVGEARAPEVTALLEEPLADELTRRGGLRFGALFHDLGKPATREERGPYVTFIGHDREGARIVRELCARLRTSRRFADYQARIALNHLRLGFLVPQRPLPRRTVYEYLLATEPDSVDVTLLTAADRLSARGGGATASREMIEGHLELAAEMVGEALAWRRAGPPRAPIRGDELAAELGIERGPELGRILREIEAAVFAGEVASREDAVAFARGRVGAI